MWEGVGEDAYKALAGALPLPSDIAPWVDSEWIEGEGLAAA